MRLELATEAAAAEEVNNRHYWYGEHDDSTDTSSGRAGLGRGGGGIGAWSSDDFITWRNEGIVLDYDNITDMVRGHPGPFVAERPKVVFNPRTRLYVMWFTIDLRQSESAYESDVYESASSGQFRRQDSTFGNTNRDEEDTLQNEQGNQRLRDTEGKGWRAGNHDAPLGLAGIATSVLPNGPFDFVRYLPGETIVNHTFTCISSVVAERRHSALRTSNPAPRTPYSQVVPSRRQRHPRPDPLPHP